MPTYMHLFFVIDQVFKLDIITSDCISIFCQYLNRAATCDFQQCGFLTSVDSDEPVQPPFKLGSSKGCSVISSTLIEHVSD